MRNFPKLNWPAFAAEAAALRAKGHEVFTPTEFFEAMGVDPENPPEMSQQFIADCLSAAIKEMGSCHAIRLLPSWEKSSGARAERAAAQAIGLLIEECPI
jgi:hypothetical protein